MYCPYPGTIKNGQILLVGVIGKYEYRQYVRRIGHNEEIEYQCAKGKTFQKLFIFFYGIVQDRFTLIDHRENKAIIEIQKYLIKGSCQHTCIWCLALPHTKLYFHMQFHHFKKNSPFHNFFFLFLGHL